MVRTNKAESNNYAMLTLFLILLSDGATVSIDIKLFTLFLTAAELSLVSDCDATNSENDGTIVTVMGLYANFSAVSYSDIMISLSLTVDKLPYSSITVTIDQG